MVIFHSYVKLQEGILKTDMSYSWTYFMGHMMGQMDLPKNVVSSFMANLMDDIIYWNIK